MLNKDKTLYGTIIYNHETKEKGIILCTWVNKFADAEIDFATCIDEDGRKYNIKMDSIQPYEDWEADNED